MNRRIFLRNSGIAAVGSLLATTDVFSKAAATHPVGIQLFTVMKEIDQDLHGTLKKIADLGFKEIESAFSMKGGYYGLKASEFNSLLKDFGLSWKSHHVVGAPFKLPPDAKGADGKPLVLPPIKNLKENYKEIIDDCNGAGFNYLVCASTPIGTSDEVKDSMETLVKTGEALKNTGVTLAYHNHDAEFKEVDGKRPYDQFLSQISNDILKFELDLAWVTKAGVDPVALFKKNPGRFPLWHVKDFDKEFKTLLPVGQGVVDFKRIFANAKVAGMKHFFVEHDMPANAFESIAASIKYINTVIKPA